VTEFKQAEQIKAFADEVFELSTASWKVQSRTHKKLEHELSETEFLALDILAKADRPYTVGEIQREIGILPAQMSRVIRSLETKAAKPLVSCKINLTDKRKVDVELTREGMDAYQTYRQIKLGAIQEMLEKLNEHDRNEFIRILRLIRENVHNLMQAQNLQA